MDHRMVHTLAASEFSQDLRSSRAILEDISGRKVIGYRAPTFSITHETAWAIDALCEAGYEYD